MPNIAINTYCNLSCKYCFADDMISKSHTNISIEMFKNILKWVAKSPINHIGIIGGEPTIHPKFDQILTEVNTYCRELETTATIFTNGIYLDKWIPYIGQSTGILINYNSPDEMSNDKFARLTDTMEHLQLLDWFNPKMPKVTIGCNLYSQRSDYRFIWDAVNRYNLKHIRVSVTSPVLDEHKHNKEEYYNFMKPIFLDFCAEAKNNNVELGADCNQIPDCYFTRDELDLIYEVEPSKGMNKICEPVIDITPDFKASACFGCYDPIDCRDFPTIEDLQRYILHKVNYPRVCANATGRCAKCKNHELLLCQGGCLAFADMTNGETP